MWTLGFTQFRVRHHDQIARIEVPPEEMGQLLSLADRVVAEFERLGYTYVTLDLAGYRRGSLNKGLASIIPEEDVGIVTR